MPQRASKRAAWSRERRSSLLSEIVRSPTRAASRLRASWSARNVPTRVTNSRGSTGFSTKSFTPASIAARSRKMRVTSIPSGAGMRKSTMKQSTSCVSDHASASVDEEKECVVTFGSRSSKSACVRRFKRESSISTTCCLTLEITTPPTPRAASARGRRAGLRSRAVWRGSHPCRHRCMPAGRVRVRSR